MTSISVYVFFTSVILSLHLSLSLSLYIYIYFLVMCCYRIFLFMYTSIIAHQYTSLKTVTPVQRDTSLKRCKQIAGNLQHDKYNQIYYYLFIYRYLNYVPWFFLEDISRIIKMTLKWMILAIKYLKRKLNYKLILITVISAISTQIFQRYLERGVLYPVGD